MSNHLIPTFLKPSSTSSAFWEVNHLTSSHRCFHTPPFCMSKPSKFGFFHPIFYECHFCFASNHLIHYPIQSRMMAHPPSNHHLRYHQPMDLSSFYWPILIVMQKVALTTIGYTLPFNPIGILLSPNNLDAFSYFCHPT